MRGTGGTRRTARWAAIVLGVAVAGTGVASDGASARAAGKPSKQPAPTVTEVVAPFDEVVDHSTCIDQKMISCHVFSQGNVNGTGFASGSVAPQPAGSGRALGQGGPRATVPLAKPAAAVRVTFGFQTHDAEAAVWVQDVCAPFSSHPCSRLTAESVDLSVRAMLGGFVSHSSCAACTAVVHRVIADADPLTRAIGPRTTWSEAMEVVVEVRNSTGEVPAGTLTAVGLFVADVGPAQGKDQLLYASKGYATVSGALRKITVERLAA